MSAHRLLDDLAIGSTTPSGAVVHGRIDDAWGIVFAQGGVVMAVMLQAAEMVLDRSDLRLATVAATFCRPVPCGPVTVDVTVLRGGRHGAQVHVELRVDGDDDLSPNAVATVVCATESPGWPAIDGLDVPEFLARRPDDAGPRVGAPPGRESMAFFRQTEWREATPAPAGTMHRQYWFAFEETPLRADGTWVPAMLAVPADALGMAAGPPASAVVGAITAPSLQISLQFLRPARGRWLAIDNRCFDNRGSLATGVATLWTADGTLVASATQTTMLRRIRS